MIIEKKFQELKRNFPKSEPYVLTHGDLNLSNIIVQDDKIEAIINWECSGYYPWWALFDPIWADIHPGVDQGTWVREIWQKFWRIREIWDECHMYAPHPDNHTKWLRPGFCICKPCTGFFSWTDLGNQAEHKLQEERLPWY